MGNFIGWSLVKTAGKGTYDVIFTPHVISLLWNQCVVIKKYFQLSVIRFLGMKVVTTQPRAADTVVMM